MRFIFVATRREDVPAECVRYISVDGSVPGASATWDHHTTGEAINLDAMPDTFDLQGFDGIGTTLADLDAAASVVAALLGGKALLPASARKVLECASFWCDHLAPHPGHGEGDNRLGRGLLDALAPRLSGPPSESSARFAEVCRELFQCVTTGATLPYADTFEHALARAAALDDRGDVVRYARVALIRMGEERGLDPAAIYRRLEQPVAVFLERHADGGRKYTVGVNPGAPGRPTDLRPALEALAASEFAHGLPCVGPEPRPGNENWGGRATVFGSPFNYGSRLGPDEVVDVVAAALGLG